MSESAALLTGKKKKEKAKESSGAGGGGGGGDALREDDGFDPSRPNSLGPWQHNFYGVQIFFFCFFFLVLSVRFSQRGAAGRVLPNDDLENVTVMLVYSGETLWCVE